MRSIAGACLTVAMVVALGAQATTPPVRVLSERTRAFVSVEALMEDVASADVVFLNERASGPDLHRFEAALLRGLAGRRDVILALDAVDRDAQDPVEHFQMEHLSDEEFVAQARMSDGARQAYLPLLKLAVARRWPIVATGGVKTDGQAAMVAPLVQAIAIGSIGGKRPLLVSLHAGADDGVIGAAADAVLAQSSGKRAVTVALVAVPSLEGLTPPAVGPPGPAYVIYTLTNR